MIEIKFEIESSGLLCMTLECMSYYFVLDNISKIFSLYNIQDFKRIFFI